MEFVNLIAGKIVDSLYGGVERQLGYLIHYNDNVENFRKQTEKLGDLKERLQGRIDDAQRNGQQIETDVQKWVDGVEDATVDAKNFFAKEERAHNRWCINIISRYKFSRQAYKKTLVISGLQDEGKFDTVSRRAPPPGIISSSTHISRAFESRQSIMRQVMEALIDENIHMIGICGMGGIGKTTMAKEIGKNVKDDKLFDEVVMAVVSQAPDLIEIQKKIAKMLGLNLDGDSVSERAGSLWQRMQQKRILVILDDVWGRLDLEELGIPFGNDHKNCKIILTSRSTHVCDDMDANKIFPVGALSEEESWDLFAQMAGKAAMSDDINPIARKVAAKCGGLPIAILTVGRALRNKKKSEWNNAARQLKKSVPTTIQGMDREVFSKLKLSYNYLERNDAKSCFLLCCLFPEDFEIPVEALVRYGMGLRLFQDVDTLEDARGSTRDLVSTLISSFLLLDGHQEGYVKMHDVVRDFAISIATEGKHVFLVKANTGLREWPNNDTFDNFTSISLMSNDIHELPDGLECPKLQALLLQRHSSWVFPINYSLVIPTNFFQGMKYLKVLDMSLNNISLLPQSIELLAELRTLCLDFCKLGDISVIGKLIKLEILTFSGSDIKEIPQHFSQLTHLRYFELNDCQALVFISPGVISSLGKLEELYMRNSFLHWDTEAEGPSRRNASIFELRSLTRLTILHTRIPDSRFLPTDLKFQNLESYTITIGYNDIDYTIYSCSRTLRLTHDMRTPLLDWVKNLLKRAESVTLLRCIGLRNIFHEFDEEFIELKSLEIRLCDEMACLLNTMEVVPQFPFRRLELLFINDLLNFCQICHGELPPESFSNVRNIGISNCPGMLSIVPPELLLRLRKLEKLSAGDCASLLYVFELEGLVIQNEETKFLSMLEELSVAYVPEMTHLWRGSTHLISLCSLKMVRLDHCMKLRTLFPPALVQDLVCLENLQITWCNKMEEIFTNQEAEDEEKIEIVTWKKDHNVVPCFKNLTYVEISFCDELRILFPHSIAKGLVQLEGLRISFCRKLKEIVVNEEGEAASTENIVFPHLRFMELQVLGGLTSFYSGHHTIEWPALDNLKIDSCFKLQTFANGLQVTPKLKKVTFRVSESCWMGDLNSTVHHLFKEELWELGKPDQ